MSNILFILFMALMVFGVFVPIYFDWKEGKANEERWKEWRKNFTNLDEFKEEIK